MGEDEASEKPWLTLWIRILAAFLFAFHKVYTLPKATPLSLPNGSRIIPAFPSTLPTVEGTPDSPIVLACAASISSACESLGGPSSEGRNGLTVTSSLGFSISPPCCLAIISSIPRLYPSASALRTSSCRAANCSFFCFVSKGVNKSLMLLGSFNFFFLKTRNQSV